MLMKSLTFPASLDSLEAIASSVLAAADAAGLDPRASYHLRLAVDEFVTNIVLHGYAGAVAAGTVDVRIEMDDEALGVILEDTGASFDARRVPPPQDLHLPLEQRRMGGLGVYLALQGVDDFTYERIGNRNRNRFVMIRRRSPRVAAPAPDRRRVGIASTELTPVPTMKGKIGVLIESHFDEAESRRFRDVFPANGYALEYLSHLWGHSQLTFKGNDNQDEVVVSVEVNDASPADYAGLILIGGYSMDRLRYEESPQEGRPNQAPAVAFLRRAVAEMERGSLRIGAICHGLWLFCASPELLRGRRVTCAHNIISDVTNAGGIPVYEGNRLKDVWAEGNLITGRHPGVVEEFMRTFLEQLENIERPKGQSP
jgi:putative intracellular protease/amidase/anti-sigma regulatory factor (Ser/Thr protein kinase)